MDIIIYMVYRMRKFYNLTEYTLTGAIFYFTNDIKKIKSKMIGLNAEFLICSFININILKK